MRVMMYMCFWICCVGVSVGEFFFLVKEQDEVGTGEA